MTSISSVGAAGLFSTCSHRLLGWGDAVVSRVQQQQWPGCKCSPRRLQRGNRTCSGLISTGISISALGERFFRNASGIGMHRTGRSTELFPVMRLCSRPFSRCAANLAQASGVGCWPRNFRSPCPQPHEHTYRPRHRSHSGCVNRDGGSKTVTDDANTLGVDFWTRRNEGQGVLGVGNLIKAANLAALALAFATTAHVKAKGRIASSSTFGPGSRREISSLEPTNPCSTRNAGQAYVRATFVWEMQNPGQFEAV